MTVSFCIIAYNEEKTLPSLFRDIRAQDYPHEKIELVLVDSMSADGTEALMHAFAEEENGFLEVKVCRNPRRSQAAGWNVAIQAASGDVVLRMDAHAGCPASFVTDSIRGIESGEDVCGGQCLRIMEKDTPWAHTILLAESSMFGSSIAPYRKSTRKAYTKSVSHGAYRREVFERTGLFNEALGRTEDNEMHYRVRRAGYNICYMPEIVSYQYMRGSWHGVIKQKYGNGRWIGLTLGICPQCFSLYHFVPLCFVLSLLCSALLLAAGWRLPFIVLASAYALVNVVMTAFAVRGQKLYVQYLLLPWMFLSLHAAYGCGTAAGIAEMPFFLKRCKKETGEQEYAGIHAAGASAASEEKSGNGRIFRKNL